MTHRASMVEFFVRYDSPATNRSSPWYELVYGTLTGLDVYPLHTKDAGYLLSPDLVHYLTIMDGSTLMSGISQQNSWAPVPKPANFTSEDVALVFGSHW